MAGFTFPVGKAFLLWLAGVVRTILQTTSTSESKDRWDNLQECLRMASRVVEGIREREALSKVSLLLFVAWETSATGEVPNVLPLEDGQVCLTCHVPEADASELRRLKANRDLHLDEFGTAEQDLATLISHIRETAFEGSAVDAVYLSQHAMGGAVDALSGH
eukprot:s4446_g2.t1